MNVAANMPHQCDIVRNNMPVVNNATRDAYRQPRVTPQTIMSEVPCVFNSNIARNLFMTDAMKSAGSILATVFLDGDTIGPDGVHLGDVVTNVADKRGNVVSTHQWFIYRISQFTGPSGPSYTQVMVARDESGPRN